MVKDTLNWLSSRPAESDLFINKDGCPSLTIDAVKDQLDLLCDYKWGDRDFSHIIIPDQKERWLISGSLTMYVEYDVYDAGGVFVKSVKRQLTGAATYFSDKFLDNDHFAATCKSLCRVNAALDLGNKFGRLLSFEFEQKRNDNQIKAAITKLTS